MASEMSILSINVHLMTVRFVYIPVHMPYSTLAHIVIPLQTIYSSPMAPLHTASGTEIMDLRLHRLVH